MATTDKAAAIPSEAVPPDTRIVTPCPKCGRTTLFVDGDGRLLCAAVDPTGLTKLCVGEAVAPHEALKPASSAAQPFELSPSDVTLVAEGRRVCAPEEDSARCRDWLHANRERLLSLAASSAHLLSLVASSAQSRSIYRTLAVWADHPLIVAAHKAVEASVVAFLVGSREAHMALAEAQQMVRDEMDALAPLP